MLRLSSSSSFPFSLSTSSSSSSSSSHLLRLRFPSRSLLLSPRHPPPSSSSFLRRSPKPLPPPLLRLAAAAMASSDAGVAGSGLGDPRIPRIASSIRVIPNFPKPGVMFQDITTLLLDHMAFKDTIDIFVERYRDKGITVVADPWMEGRRPLVSLPVKNWVSGVEARGFIFGAPIALAIGAKFVPLRKPKKLPGEVISEEYSLEYGTDRMEMHVGAVEPGDRAVVIDDLIATGGTLCAAIRLLERVGAELVECACAIELPELKGREKLGDRPLFVLVEAA